MKKSIATVSLSGTLREKLEAVAAAGFSGVEIFENDLLSFDGSAQDVRHLTADLGLEIVVFQPFRDFEGMPEPQRARNFERAERKFDLMQTLGVDLLLVCSNVSPLSKGGINRAADDLAQLGEQAAKRGLRIGYEALAWGRHISDYRDAWEVVRRANHPAVGTIIDSFHVFARQLELNTLTSIPGDRIFLIHVADAPLFEMDSLSWSRHFRCFPGQGRLALAEFASAVAATEYAGWYSLEIFNDHFRAAPAHQTALDGYRSLIYLEEQTTLQQVTTPKGAGMAPAPPSITGVEFIEFAVDDSNATNMETLFAALGFTKLGQHESRAASLWQQDGIHLVLNTDNEGFAHEYQHLHGSAVCSIGLRVDDAALAIARAKAYRAQVAAGGIVSSLIDAPAVLPNVDEHLLYFIDDDIDWKSIFSSAIAPVTSQSAAIGLTHVDHLAQVVFPAQLSSVVLFYNAVLGFDVADQHDIADPQGLIQSQVVETDSHSVRIALNSSQSQHTLAGKFLAEFLGSGIQHIAFYTPDIFACVVQLQRNGLNLLSIPANYYDDLDARYGLDTDLLTQLQAHDILYTRTEAGEFFHVYTQLFAGQLFFEIVERRNYQGFGASNAAIRLASQARTASTL